MGLQTTLPPDARERAPMPDEVVPAPAGVSHA